MKPLVKPQTTRKMFHALWDEMVVTHGFNGPKPRFYISKTPFPQDHQVFGSALAITDFAKKLGGWDIQEHAKYMAVNAWCYPIMDEEEMMYVLIHEIAHCIAGLEAQHTWEWGQVMQESCGIMIPYMMIRRRMEYLDLLPESFHGLRYTRTLDDWFNRAEGVR